MPKLRSIVTDGAQVYVDSEAARCLKSALDALKREKKISLREVARRLKYKQPVTLSQMANGRMPIPVERAAEIAQAVGIDPDYFTKIVLKQRYPNLEISLDREISSFTGLIDVIDVDAEIFGSSSTLTLSQQRVVREVLRDKKAEERWLSVHEVDAVRMIRQLRPDFKIDGLSGHDLDRIRSALSS